MGEKSSPYKKCLGPLRGKLGSQPVLSSRSVSADFLFVNFARKIHPKNWSLQTQPSGYNAPFIQNQCHSNHMAPLGICFARLRERETEASLKNQGLVPLDINSYPSFSATQFLALLENPLCPALTCAQKATFAPEFVTLHCPCQPACCGGLDVFTYVRQGPPASADTIFYNSF